MHLLFLYFICPQSFIFEIDFETIIFYKNMR